MKNILMVSHSDFPMNSAIHVHHFANELIKLGLDCIVAVPWDEKSVTSISGSLYKVTRYEDIANICSYFSNHQPPDIVHCWTPREHVRIYCYHLASLYNFKLIIHWEDSEECIIERFFNIPVKNCTSEFDRETALRDRILPYNLSHPQKYKEFLSTADGVTIIIDKLREFIPVSIPTITLYPGVDTAEFSPREKNTTFLQELGIAENTTILVYTGIIHPTNLEEVRRLYLAVGKRNKRGKPTVLIRTGVDNHLALLEENELWIKEYIKELGWVERKKIPDILALADVLIQPGKSDDFNDYRLPSKIPEFLAMGKPVILPDTNIGKVLTHLENAIVLPNVDEESLQSAMDLVINDQVLAQKLSENGIKFAQNFLNWSNNTKKLYNFYQSLYTKEKEAIYHKNIIARSNYYKQDLDKNYHHSAWQNLQLSLIKDNLQKKEAQIRYLEEINHNRLMQINNLENININNQLKIQNLAQELSKKDNHIELINNNLISQENKLPDNNIHIKIEELENKNILLQEEINAMKTSKFWRIRDKWFSLKRLLGLKY
ncbi:glycosyltransferase family 4 protein [Geminocystis herdmanii]|uniref:glycosyltransferase family 4 protein n=1 Tax=Geminocystis herdmanii TaxID=669359 RepID=UPI0003458F66|nr:glycosyltransferase family 4 protein [Geminocystis herdmanii]